MTEPLNPQDPDPKNRYMNRVFLIALPVVMAPCLVAMYFAYHTGNYLPFWGTVAYSLVMVWVFRGYERIGRNTGRIEGWSQAYMANKDRVNGPFNFDTPRQ